MISITDSTFIYMDWENLNSIDEVITLLGEIIADAETNQNTLGYFAALYQKVTMKVKSGIAEGFFEDGPRMEQLDIVFAQRYLAAYYAYQETQPTTAAWQRAFDLSTDYWPIVLQHLVMGINAHINLDLGIAAAEIAKGQDIEALAEDFKKINTILGDLVQEVQDDLARIWPTLIWILKRTRKVDDFFIDFSMELARDGAWRFAKDLAAKPEQEWPALIAERDEKVARQSRIVSHPGRIASFVLRVARLGERGSVSEKIGQLKAPPSLLG